MVKRASLVLSVKFTKCGVRGISSKQMFYYAGEGMELLHERTLDVSCTEVLLVT